MTTCSSTMRWVRALGPLLSASVALVLVSAAGASEAPTLQPGTTAIVAGAHVRCAAAKASVICAKVGGLTATIVQTGAVHVTRGSGSFPATKRRVLHNNDGFVVEGERGVSTYCHVYLAGKPVISCSLDYPDLVHTPVGFDMSDRSVVVFRYDKAGVRQDLKTIKQP